MVAVPLTLVTILINTGDALVVRFNEVTDVLLTKSQRTIEWSVAKAIVVYLM
jgi:hypothetical protein